MTADRYDPLCDVIADWLDAHKLLTKSGARPEGVSTPRAARHEYLYDAGLYNHERNGRALYEYFAWVRDPEWPERSVAEAARGDKSALAFDARVRAGAFSLLREWALVFDPRSRHLYSDQDRANVLMAVALSAQRIADEGSSTGTHLADPTPVSAVKPLAPRATPSGAASSVDRRLHEP